MISRTAIENISEETTGLVTKQNTRSAGLGEVSTTSRPASPVAARSAARSATSPSA